MTFLYIWHFSPYCPTHHTSPSRIHLKHKMFQTTVFLLPFSLLNDLSQTFIDTYKLYFQYIVSTLFAKILNQFLSPVLSSVFCYLLFLENWTHRVENQQGNLSPVKTAPKAGGLLRSVTAILESTRVSVNYQSHDNC